MKNNAPYLCRTTLRSTQVSVPALYEQTKITGAELHALDLVDSPSVRVIDVSACLEGIHLAVRNCPKLERVIVPDHGSGAILHIDFGDAPPRLEVCGIVEDFDACWIDGNTQELSGLQTPAGRTKRGPLHDAWLGTARASVPTAELVMFTGSELKCETLTLDVAREVVLQDVPTVKHLQMSRRFRKTALRAIGCPDLETIILEHRITTARVEACPKLALVKGAGRSITVTGDSSVVETLQFAGPWRHVRLTYSGPRRVNADLVDRLSVGMCRQLVHIRALNGADVVVFGGSMPTIEGSTTVRVEPLSDRMLDEALASNDAETRNAIVLWCAERRNPRDILRAVQLLRSVATTGHEPSTIWDARCRLHARMCTRRKNRDQAESLWAWRFPDDLGDRGWVADVQLWLTCRHHSLDAARYGAVMANHNDPVHLAALAGATARVGPSSRALLFHQLSTALEGGAQHGGVIGHSNRDEVVDGVHPIEMDRLSAVLQALVRHRNSEAAPTVAESLCKWVLKRMPHASGMHLLGAMRVLGNESARQSLEEVIANANRFDEEVRRVALMQMLAPVRDIALSFTPKESPAPNAERPITQEVF